MNRLRRAEISPGEHEILGSRCPECASRGTVQTYGRSTEQKVSFRCFACGLRLPEFSHSGVSECARRNALMSAWQRARRQQAAAVIMHWVNTSGAGRDELADAEVFTQCCGHSFRELLERGEAITAARVLVTCPGRGKPDKEGGESGHG